MRSGRRRAALRVSTLARVVGLALGLAVGFGLAPGPATAAEVQSEAADPALEARLMRIASELRCLVCQNQTIADSNAGLAVDLRREARELLRGGATDRQVVDYMTARYGDFVLYRPPWKATTVLLWAGPGLMLVGGAGTLLAVLRRRARLPPDAFDAEAEEDDDGDDPATERVRSAGDGAPRVVA